MTPDHTNTSRSPGPEATAAMHKVPSLRRVFHVVMAAVAVFYIAWLAVPLLVSTNLADDYRQNFIWLVQRHEGLFFEDDPLTLYSYLFQPPALAVLYRALALAVHPYQFTKVISLVLVAAFAVVMYRIGECLRPRTACAPILATLALLDVAWTREMMGGFARCFGLPIQAALVWSVFERRRLAMTVLLILAGLLHPQSLLLGVSLVVAAFVMRCWRERRLIVPGGRDWATVAVGGAVIAALMLMNNVHMREVQSRFGRPLTGREILSIAEYRPGGRWEDERPNILPSEAGLILNRHFKVFQGPRPYQEPGRLLRKSLSGILIIIVVLEVLRRFSGCRWRELPGVIPSIVILGAAWNVLAYVLLARLYFPNRFITAYLPLAVEMTAAFFFARWGERAAVGRRLGRTLLAPAVVFAVLVGLGVKMPEKFLPGYWVEVEPYRGVAGFLREQSPDTVFAAHPSEDADTLIVLTPRRTFIAREISHPLFRRYLDEVLRPRTRLAVRAIYPMNPRRELRALKAQGVDLLVMRRHDLALAVPPRNWADQPYLRHVRSYWTARHFERRREFWEAHEHAKVYEDDLFVVYDLRQVFRDD